MSDSRAVHPAEDWGVVLQSVPSKNKREIVKRLEEIFELEKHDAEQILSNMPLILVDNLSFGLAARVKKFFQTIGAVAETTNHDMIKKNCFQIVWPQTPDLSFFMKSEAVHTEAPAPDKKEKSKPVGSPLAEKKAEAPEVKPETPKTHETPRSSKPLQEPLASASQEPSIFSKPAKEPSIFSKPAEESSVFLKPAKEPSIFPNPAEEPQAILPQQEFTPIKPAEEPRVIIPNPRSQPLFEVKPDATSASDTDLEWERRAKELNEKLKKFHEEKQELHVQHAEATEKVKSEFQKRLEEEKKKSDDAARAYEDLQKAKLREIHEEKQALHVQHVEATEKVKSEFQLRLEEEKKKKDEIAKAYEDLQKEAQKQEALTREGEEWRSRAAALGEKVRELEENLTQKASAVQHLIQQKDDLFQRSEKASAVAQHELSTLRSREQELFRKIEDLEGRVQEMTESLRSRDGALAQFEKQILALAEKAQGYEALRQEHAQLAEERATIRQEYDSKLVDQEVRLAKAEEDHRRYRSRMDRKNAAAARELGEWIRGVDTIRQGLQKLILFLGSESAVLDSEKKSNLRSPLTRGPDVPNTEKK